MTGGRCTSGRAVGSVRRMTSLPPLAGRRCHSFLNALHSMVFFASESTQEFAQLGVTERPAANFAARAAALGPVGPGVVTAAYNSYKYEFVAQYMPKLWDTVTPAQAIAARYRAADGALRRVLGEEAVTSKEMAEAAELALRAAEACDRHGRVMYAAHADVPVPDAPHLRLWHAATLLREHRGDGHIAALVGAGLTGLDAQVTHTATGKGMAPKWVTATRGWTAEDWSAAVQGLRVRGLIDDAGELTAEGTALRERLEDDTDHLDRAPYEHLGPEAVARLTDLAGEFAKTAVVAGAFPADLLGKR